MRPAHMRFQNAVLFSGILILAAACSSPRAAGPIALSPQPADDAILSPTQAGLDPVMTARQILDAGPLDPGGPRRELEVPTPVFVHQMPFVEAHKWIPMLSQEGDQVWGSQTTVWLVVLKGRWDNGPADPAQANPQLVVQEGCLMVLFREADGALIATGDTLCPDQQ